MTAASIGTRTRGRIAIVVWLAVVVAAVVVITHARFTADLSAFLPTEPTEEQALLIDQLREGPASHLILVAIAGGDPVTDATLATLSRKTAAALRSDVRFESVNNGETVTASRDRALMFSHRYVLSDRVVPARFTAHSGATAAAAPTVTVSGCRRVAQWPP